MFDWLVILVVAIHLIAVNLAAAGPVVAPLAEWWGSRRRRAAYEPAAYDLAARELAKWAIFAAIVGFSLGLLAMGMLTIWLPAGESPYLAAMKQVTPGRWWFTGAELGFYFACMAVYVWMWKPLARFRPVHRTLALAAGANLLYHFPALFTMLALLVDRPELHGRPLDRSLYLKLLVDPETLSRVVHVWLASLAVAGLSLAWISRRLEKTSAAATDRDEDRATEFTLPAMFGGRIALAGSLLQVPVGVWVFVSLPTSQQMRLMGGDWLATALFAVSVIGALGLLHQLAMVSLGDIRAGRIRMAAALMAAVIVLMTATLHLARG